MKVIITGATGFIGHALVKALRQRDDEVVALTRDADRARLRLGADIQALEWNPPELGPWTHVFAGADGVVNLAGEPVADKRWSAAQKERILTSRVDATNAVVRAIEEANPRPRVLVNGSAVGYYGSRGNEDLTENSPPGSDFLAYVVKEWEAAAQPVETLGVRLVLIRTGGIVLGADGGALPRMELPFRFFGGGTMGNPGQWVSWIHIEDEVGLILYALDHDTVRGPVNASAPQPVTMEVFSRELGQALGRPSWVPMMGTMMRLVLGERAEAIMASLRVLPSAAEGFGYRFRHTSSAEALQSILGT
jgi:uncharacterized protein (TIGR01777 family)